jgi:hypothetical protein
MSLKKKRKEKEKHVLTKTNSQKTPSLTVDQILNMNKATTTSNTQSPLPSNFPPEPIVGEFNAKSEEEYKAHMKRKYLKEQWDNAVVLYRMKEKANDKEGMRQVIIRITSQINSESQNLGKSEEKVDPSSFDNDRQDVDYPQKNKELDNLLKELHENEDLSDSESSTSVQQPPPSSKAVYPKTSSPPPLPNRSNKSQSEDSEYSSQSSGAALRSSEYDSYSSREKNPENSDSDDEDGWRANWYNSVLYNQFLNRNRRRILYIPIQVFFIIMIVVATAVSTVAAGIICALVCGCFSLALSIWIIWSYRYSGKSTVVVVSVAVLEVLAEILALIGGFANDGKFVFYVGIPAIILVIIGTLIAWFGIFNYRVVLDSSPKKSEIV